MSEKLKVHIIVGSVREGRVALPVARWVRACAGDREAVHTELVDLADWPLPMFSLASSPAMGGYKDPLQLRWAAKIAEADAYIMVSPEYNHSTSAVLKNALDYLYAEWNRKPVAFVSYGNSGGARAVEQLRAIAIELRMAPLGEAVHIFSVREKLKGGHFEGDDRDKKQLTQLFDSITWWGEALRTARR